VDSGKRREEMKKGCFALAGVLVVWVLFSSTAVAWGPATHAYIDDQLNHKLSLLKLNQRYGSMTPDVFNFVFESPYPEMALATHCESLRVWNAARWTQTQKALAFGFVSHNIVWGADFTAHHPGCLPDPHPTEGYAVTKAGELKSAIEASEVGGSYYLLHKILVDAIGEPEAEVLESELLQDLVEYGVDILMKRSDPTIGQKVTAAALLRSPELPALLVRAYAADFAAKGYFPNYWQAAAAIASAEMQFRQTIIAYGQALTQDEATAVQLIAEQVAQFAVSLLAAQGVTLPPGTDLRALVTFAIQKSVELCESDYADEMTETVGFVRQQLKTNGVWY
jgi:hypothetical protein